MAANTQAKPSPKRMQVLLRPEDAARLASLQEQYRVRHGVPLRRRRRRARERLRAVHAGGPGRAALRHRSHLVVLPAPDRPGIRAGKGSWTCTARCRRRCTGWCARRLTPGRKSPASPGPRSPTTPTRTCASVTWHRGSSQTASAAVRPRTRCGSLVGINPDAERYAHTLYNTLLHEIGHALKGDRAGRYAVRLTANWRLTFGWAEDSAVDVDIEDYHQ